MHVSIIDLRPTSAMSVTRFLAHLISLISFLPSAVWLFNKSCQQNRSVSAEWPDKDVITSWWRHPRKYPQESRTRTCKYLHVNALVWIRVQEWSVLLSKRAVQVKTEVKNTQTWDCFLFCFFHYRTYMTQWTTVTMSTAANVWLASYYKF